MEKQNLPTYIHDFLNERRWVIRSTEHYIFRYFPKSEAEIDIDRIVMIQEKAFAKITNFLSVLPPKRKIGYYFYPDEITKKSLMGDNWYAQSIRDEFRIHVLYTKDIKPVGEHEDTHLLSLPWGISIGLFQEGLAEFMVGHAWDGRTHLSYVKEGYQKQLYLPLSEYFRHTAWLETNDSMPLYYYSLAGSFITFLLNAYSKQKFEDCYKNMRRAASKSENLATFNKIYGSLETIEKEFMNSIG